MCAIDTSIYYGPSELVLGNALNLLQNEFPRSSYKLVRGTEPRPSTNADVFW